MIEENNEILSIFFTLRGLSYEKSSYLGTFFKNTSIDKTYYLYVREKWLSFILNRLLILSLWRKYFARIHNVEYHDLKHKF